MINFKFYLRGDFPSVNIIVLQQKSLIFSLVGAYRKTFVGKCQPFKWISSWEN